MNTGKELQVFKAQVLRTDSQSQMIKVISAHSEGIASVAISPDGNTFLTGSYDKTAILWNKGGEMLHVFEGHTTPVTAVQFSADGESCLTGSVDGTFLRWDTKTGQNLDSSKGVGYVRQTNPLCFSPDGSKCLMGLDGPDAVLWDRSFRRPFHVLKGHTDYVLSTAFSPDGTTCLTGSSDNTAILWDVETGRQLYVFKKHQYPVEIVSFSRDGNTCFTGSIGEVFVWQNPRVLSKLLLDPFMQGEGEVEIVKQQTLDFLWNQHQKEKGLTKDRLKNLLQVLSDFYNIKYAQQSDLSSQSPLERAQEFERLIRSFFGEPGDVKSLADGARLAQETVPVPSMEKPPVALKSVYGESLALPVLGQQDVSSLGEDPVFPLVVDYLRGGLRAREPGHARRKLFPAKIRRFVSLPLPIIRTSWKSGFMKFMTGEWEINWTVFPSGP